jgi:hypothetical protein
MKVTNWRRKLMASLVAGGMLSPSIACAANLDTNLIANPGFESVNDTGTLGEYNSPRINGWTPSAPDKQGFAYSHNGSLSSGNPVPNYANGAPLASGGNWYFTPNAEPNDAVINGPGQFFQDIDVSTGPSGGLIPDGIAAYKIGAFFNNFETQGDFGHLHLDFRNSTGTSIGAAEVVGVPPFDEWEQNSRNGLIPVGTHTVRVSIYGTTPVGGGPDGYMDNVDFQITNAANELLFLQVNTTTGQVSMRNMTGDPVAIDYYEITSASNALNATAWNSLQEQNLAGFPAGNGSGNGWEQFGGSDAGVIGESYLTGNSSVANNATIGLGNAYNVAGARDLVFKYGAVTSSVQVQGDYNVNGTVDAADYVLWRENLNQNVTLPNDPTPGMVTAADYDVWRTNFGRSGPPAGPSMLNTGFVRYVTSGLASRAAVPEPATVLLVGIGFAPLVAAGRRKRTND